MRKSLIIVIASFIVVVLLVNYFVHKPTFKTPEDRLEFVLKEKQNERLDLIYLEIVAKDSMNIDNHYGLITSYFAYPPGSRIINEKDLINIYWTYTDYDDLNANDIGYYSLGLISSMKQDYNNALIYFTQVNNTELKYLNNSTGSIYLALQDYNQAEEYYKKAIEANGNLEGAYKNLINLYSSQNRINDLYELLKEKKARKYFPSQLKRYLFLSNFNLLGYFESVFSHTYQNQSLIGFLGALLVMFSWLFYLRKIEIGRAHV